MRIFSKFIHIERFENYFNKLDKYKDKSISFFNDYIPTQEELSLSKVNIFNILEPNEFFGIHNYVEYNSNSFDKDRNTLFVVTILLLFNNSSLYY